MHPERDRRGGRLRVRPTQNVPAETSPPPPRRTPHPRDGITDSLETRAVSHRCAAVPVLVPVRLRATGPASDARQRRV